MVDGEQHAVEQEPSRHVHHLAEPLAVGEVERDSSPGLDAAQHPETDEVEGDPCDGQRRGQSHEAAPERHDDDRGHDRARHQQGVGQAQHVESLVADEGTAEGVARDRDGQAEGQDDDDQDHLVVEGRGHVHEVGKMKAMPTPTARASDSQGHQGEEGRVEGLERLSGRPSASSATSLDGGAAETQLEELQVEHGLLASTHTPNAVLPR